MDASSDVGEVEKPGKLVCYVNIFGRENTYYQTIGFIRSDISAERIAGLLKKISQGDYAAACKILRSWGVW